MDEQGFDRRISALERWRDVIDNERGQIMGELGEIKGLMTGVGTQMAGIVSQLEGIREQLEERPSRTEYKETERQIASIRAKGKELEAKTSVGLLSKLEVTGPGGMTFKLFGVSGVTIVVVFFLIVMILALWILRK